MGESFRPQKDPLVWRMAEGVLINLLLLIAGVVALGTILYEGVRKMWIEWEK